MVTDAILAPILAVVAKMVDLLPDGTAFSLPAIAGLWDWLLDFNTLIPVYGPVVAMLAVLSAVVVFVTVRLILTIWNLIYP